jgi:hypothetical protein
MAGFEVVVRPAVFPDIRPPPARSLPIEDAPDKGIAVINGIGNSIIDLTYSFSSSWTRARLVESRRTFDTVRVYARRGSGSSGSVDKSTYVDFEVATAIDYFDNGQETLGTQYARPQASKGVEIISSGNTR